MNHEKTMKNLSDHQILEMVEVMMSDDHCPRDNTAVYVAAYNEAMRRPSVKAVIDLCDRYKED